MKITRTCWGCGKKYYAYKRDELDAGLCQACGSIINDVSKRPTPSFVIHRIKSSRYVKFLRSLNNIPFWYGVGFGAVFTLCSVLAVFVYKLDECRLTTDAESCVVRIEPK